LASGCSDHLIADAYNYGYVKLWSQDRDYQWINDFDEAKRQCSDGYGYLRVSGTTSTTLAMGRGASAVDRRFGIGYFHHAGSMTEYRLKYMWIRPRFSLERH
jgi:hypothetical protein